MKHFIFFTILFALIWGCSDNKKEQNPQNEMSQNDPHLGVMPEHNDLKVLADNSNQDFSDPIVKISGIELKTPDTWKREAPSSSIRALQFAIKSDENLKVTGFFFGEQDLVKENLDRWKAEFIDIKKEDNQKMNDDINFIILEGVYKLKPFPMAQEFTPTDNYMVLASIVPTPEGPYYFKVYGPKATLSKEIESFKTFLKSYKKI